ncbi:NLR family CARD domain-containing protein 3 [Boleophthalmus pectinirostris]|uniref:NLR family CARD domain-containing protein 3 n=1 Tax=Boleophthalmus pectinirostris TaxID=150288 RepID=UPI000A1C5685|nr:NLR family CARD domain-containing protein 3 [Boleophthalmus pectinirostris]
MEKKIHYDSFLDRSKRIMWQDDCYVDLQSSSSSQASQLDTEDSGWIQQHQEQLCRFITSSFLEQILSHLKRMNVLSSCEESRIHRAGQLHDQVTMLTAVISGKDSPACNVLRDFVQKSHSQEAQLIISYDFLVQEHKAVLLRRCDELRDKVNLWSQSLLLVEGLSDLQQKEHDLMQVQVTWGAQRSPVRELNLTALLEPLSRASMPPRVSLTVGVAGVGKSTWVRHLVKLWSQGAVCPEISFMFPLSFCELNSLEKLSAERLLKLAFPHLSDPSLVLSSHCRTLLILDGLDHFRGTLNFSEATPCNDPKKEVSVEELITNIIRGNLLPHMAVWVTSRPGAASLIPGGLIDRVSEIPGFSQKDIKTFLNHFFSENDYNNMIWAHLEDHKTLMALCYIPAISWIMADTLKFIIQSDCHSHLPRTCTELFAHFCLMKAEAGEPRGREPVKTELLHGTNRKLLWSLGRLAFYALLRHKDTFNEQDLRAYGIDQALLQCSLGTGVLMREESLISTVYRFTHLSIHEFFAAIFYYVSSKRAIFDLFSESTVSWPKIGFQNHFKNAFQYSQQAVSGHFDVFVRFLSGLLNPQVFKPLSALVTLWKDDGSQKAWAAGFLHSLLSSGGLVVSLRSVNLVYCLHELQHLELLRSVEEDLRLGSLSRKMSRAQCVVLSYLLQVSPECSQQTNLTNCLNYNTVQCLLPQLLYCSHLRLENNQFKDDVMELLGSLLSAKDCHIRKMSLADNSISKKGAKSLSRALMVNRTLTSLNLRSNHIGSKGVKLLAEALKMNQSLVSVNLQNNGIDEEGAQAAAEVLKCNRKLVSLNLRKNMIGADGVKKIAEALKTNRTLKKLVLCSNHLGDKGTVALAGALTTNHTLLCLQLQSNSISNKGMTALTEALRLNHGLVTLNLRENSIGVEGAKDMAQALYKNSTLQELDLTANLLHDEGVQAIAGAIKSNQSLISLHLQWNFVKSPATKALAQALLCNTTMQLLDLQENAIGNEGIVSLAEALKSNTSLQTLCLQGVSAGTSGAIALAESLTTNQTLITLDLRGNTVGVEGAKALANALKINRSLKSLNLQENSLGMDGAIFIATALKGNHQLSYINLQGNGVGESGAKVISDAIRSSAPGCIVDI